jgi:hypothetical protein
MCMATGQAMIAVKPETRDRLFRLKKKSGVSYDEVVSRAVTLLEEKEESRSQPGSKETGYPAKETQ